MRDWKPETEKNYKLVFTARSSDPFFKKASHKWDKKLKTQKNESKTWSSNLREDKEAAVSVLICEAKEGRRKKP